MGLGLAPAPAVGAAASEIERAAQEAARAAELAPLTERLAERVHGFDGRVEPARLEAAVESLGGLVSRGRDLDADRAHFEALVRIAALLEEDLARARTRREEEAGGDEAALEALYRSREWRRLDYAEVTLGYWLGWARVGEAQRTPSGEARRRAMKEAERAFSRASLEMALPRIATLSLLGLGIVWRELGETDRAQRALERFEEQMVDEASEDLLGAARYELAALAFEAGDVERGRRQAARIPDSVLDRASELGLLRLELDARLSRLPPEGAGSRGEAPALDRVAELLRRLSRAGGEHAKVAAARVLEHRRLLAGLDVGPAGDLVRAEDAYAEERYEAARGAYARALDAEASLAGLDLDVARYKYAVALAKTGGPRERAIEQLEGVLEGGGGGAVRKPAARLYFSLAEAAALEGAGGGRAARARRAAQQLLDVDPQAPQADRARYRLARSGGAGGTGERVRLLEAVPEFSEVYPAARLELVRLRAERMQRLEDAGRAESDSMRAAAEALARDLDVAATLVAEGRLEARPERDARLAVLRAKAAARAGRSAERVLELVEAASARPGLDAEARRALLRLHLEALSRSGRFGQIARMLFEAPEGAVRRHWAVWYESLRRLKEQSTPRPPSGLLVRIHARLAALAPSEYRDPMALDEAEALLEAGEAAEAASRARALVEEDPTWGNARHLYARALEASGDVEGAGGAWEELAAGLEPGSELWLEAQLGRARARERSGDAEGVCRIVEEARGKAPALGDRALRERFEALGRGCPEPAGPPTPRAAEGPSGTSPP